MCSPKTMLKIGAIIGVLLIGGYVFLPEFRTGIASLAPFALFALCPLSMLFGMHAMKDNKCNNSCSSCTRKSNNNTKPDKDENIINNLT
ncbi:MAG: hypothetical protein COY81_00460 [Candidatus Pacebacteria bacterium CG_4_10_14_0_8_um_filter_43_12]|uniref:DUF2933 domain-containing protein n=2 Tax=Candidatus Roizmaniibacteriota TaxID=1752723 RepID=A0A2M8F4X4_9BACT|nr:MAG: hypothetical protein COY81_00460 [Candidatus Pacebacteria bacterium CG_4_10_14_0_8_um_filter_43_12]PIZ79475.1 MAG: hypothetical protein COY01_00950 [Candidatus Pacebacteria bacterium CG_4_10_14_0_2_um_filter_40_20]PJC34353.1 MAG: hypothetical protein CO051_00045 [Candidatus Roizmanbacteria bacterium CG_4_9_14_0_2_um_filter_39_13]PJE61628.1 MAG: hypothetical protein COU87_03525 [Candidatus Roizmanbacteria bacterium CG10_big_fil_rev_8_21_14_0_10_39_12]